MYHEEARTFEDLIPHISARVPKADEMSIEHIARQATIDFMEDTRIFHDQVVFTGQRGVVDYILEIPDDQVMIDILPEGVTLNGNAYRAFRRDGQYQVVGLTQTAVDGGCYAVNYSYKLKPDACELPDILYDNYLTAIVNKAVTLLFTGDKDGYVSGASFQIAKQQYDSAVDTILARKLHNFSNGRPRMMRRSKRGDNNGF